MRCNTFFSSKCFAKVSFPHKIEGHHIGLFGKNLLQNRTADIHAELKLSRRNSHQEKAVFGRAVGRLHALGAVSSVLRRTRVACEACPAARADSRAHLRVETRRHGIALYPLDRGVLRRGAAPRARGCQLSRSACPLGRGALPCTRF